MFSCSEHFATPTICVVLSALRFFSDCSSFTVSGKVVEGKQHGNCCPIFCLWKRKRFHFRTDLIGFALLRHRHMIWNSLEENSKWCGHDHTWWYVASVSWTILRYSSMTKIKWPFHSCTQAATDDQPWIPSGYHLATAVAETCKNYKTISDPTTIFTANAMQSIQDYSCGRCWYSEGLPGRNLCELSMILKRFEEFQW